MDLFVLDKAIAHFFTNFNSYDLFMVSLGGMIGVYLYCGTYKSNKKSGMKK